MFAGLRERSRARRDAYALYTSIVRFARDPALYRIHGIPDTIDGRFDAILLHIFLFQERLKQDASPELLRCVSEAFVSDMDRSIREMGVGDMGVSRRMKQMGEAFFGRMKAYEACEDEQAFTAALARNVYRSDEVTESAKGLARYAAAMRQMLDRTPTSHVLAGEISTLASA